MSTNDDTKKTASETDPASPSPAPASDQDTAKPDAPLADRDLDALSGGFAPAEFFAESVKKTNKTAL
jgi:hypothetical protein